MAHTKRLYYTDSYLKEFTANIVRVENDERGSKVYLDRTAFYPDSGGQPSDYGELAGVRLLDVVDEGNDVAHVLATRPDAQSVSGAIDWQRRFDHMQQHTGQHILSAAFARSTGYKTVSFHLGAESSTIDLDSERVGARQIEAAEELANGLVFENRPVNVSIRSVAEIQELDLRKPTEREGEIRLVEIEGFDLSACGGTHVSRTGGVGNIGVRKIERAKGLTRVEFVCGGRAMRAARLDFTLLSESARAFSTAFENVPAMIAKQSQELREAGKTAQKLSDELAELEAAQLWQQAPERNGARVVRRVFDVAESRRAKPIAYAVSKHPGGIALIAVKGSPTMIFFAQAQGGRASLSDVIKQTLAKFGGKGGGGRDFSQGGGLPENQLDAALRFAESLLL